MSGWHQEQEYQAGIRAERKRIIKLLEANCGCGIWRDYLLGCPHEVAIALIKGKAE